MNTTKQSDLQSFGELEKNLYGGQDSYSYFQKDIKKCMPFTQSPMEISKCNGTANFGYSWSALVDNKSGDYLTNSWIMIQTPEITLLESNTFGPNGFVRWTENFMHNFIEECTLTFNDVVISKFDNFALDFRSEFGIDANKKQYFKMIGNDKDLIMPSKHLPSKKLFLPLPLFFAQDTGNAIPLTALPHTEIKINFKFRQWENLLIFENATMVNNKMKVPEVGKDIQNKPVIVSANIYANFVTVSEEERHKIGLKTKIMVIEQIQTCPRQMVNKNDTTKIDLLFKHSVKTLFFAIRNATYKNCWSNYNYGNDSYVGGMFVKNENKKIVKSASIKYNERDRVEEMPEEYYHFINPWYSGNRIPTKSGMYMYNFSLSMNNNNPCGGVNLSRIDTPSLVINLTNESKESEDNFELVCVAVSNNVLKISEGVGVTSM